MHTHFLSREQVAAYLNDLQIRLLDMGASSPTILCAIGYSGEVLVRELLRVSRDLPDRVAVVKVEYDQATRRLDFQEGDAADFEGRRVLVIDSSVHSGRTMLGVVRAVCGHGAGAVCTYTLVLKRGAVFVPSLWGLMIDDHDRAYFLLGRLPNNRLSVDAPYNHIRKLSESDRDLPALVTGVPSLDSADWQARYQAIIESKRQRSTYLVEGRTHIHGFVTFKVDENYLWVYELGLRAGTPLRDATYYADALLRWTETNARHSGCEEVRIWVPSTSADDLRRWGYHPIAKGRAKTGGNEHKLMAKRVLYHI
jgi:hypothetical protein